MFIFIKNGSGCNTRTSFISFSSSPCIRCDIMHSKMFSLFADVSRTFSSSSFEHRGFWKALELNYVASIYLADTKMITEPEKDDVSDLLYFGDTEASSHESDNSAKEGTECKTVEFMVTLWKYIFNIFFSKKKMPLCLHYARFCDYSIFPKILPA